MAKIVLAMLAILAALSCAAAKGATQGEAPDPKTLLCEGCRAAVSVTFAVLGTSKQGEAIAYEIVEDIPRVCDADNFKTSRWQYPPPITASACKAFLGAGETPTGMEPEEAVGKAFRKNSATRTLPSVILDACHKNAGVCSEGECARQEHAPEKEKKEKEKKEKEKKGASESRIKKSKPDSQVQAGLLAAARGDDPAAAAQALERGGDINFRDDDGHTALMAACLSGSASTVKWLLDQGADWKIGQNEGYTCLHGAAFQGKPAVAEAALDCGLPVSDMHDDGFRPIHRAAWGRSDGHAAVLKVFVIKGKEDVDALSQAGVTPLLLAAGLGRGPINLALILALIELNADVDRPDPSDGKTAVLKIMESGPAEDKDRQEAVTALLQAGASTTIKDKKSGKTIEERGRELGYGHLF